MTAADGCPPRARASPPGDGRVLGYGLYGADPGPVVVVLDGPGSRGLGLPPRRQPPTWA